MNTDARLSHCGTYRYTLSREWDPSCQPLVFCMLNPSTADAMRDDPTIRRCIGFSRANGYGGIAVVNLFAYRSTDPSALPDDLSIASGSQNVSHLRSVATGRDVVVAWGAHQRASKSVTGPALQLLHAHANRVLCLGKTKGGEPRHPLYVAAAQPLVPYEASHA